MNDSAHCILVPSSLLRHPLSSDLVRCNAVLSLSPLTRRYSINVPDGVCTYNRTRDCPTTYYPRSTIPLACVDGAILNYTSQLQTGRYLGRALSAPLMNEALKFLIHYIGDSHQPLHVGFASDAGGNALSGKFFAASSVTLHAVWDTNILARRDNDFGGQAGYTRWLTQSVNASNSQAFYRANLTSWSSCAGAIAQDTIVAGACPDSWAQESLYMACNYAYAYPNGTRIRDGFVLADAYYNRVVSQLDAQVAKCGLRLANVLNNLFGDRVPQPPPPPGPQSIVFLLNLPYNTLASNFSSALTNDAAYALGVNTTRLAVGSVAAGPVAGTIIVQLVVSEPLDPVQSTQPAQQQSAATVASLIVAALNDPASMVYTADPSSRLAQAVTGSAALQGAAAPPSDSSTADGGSSTGSDGSGTPISSSDGSAGPQILGAPVLYGILALVIVLVACGLAIWYCCCVVRLRAGAAAKHKDATTRMRGETELATTGRNPLHWDSLEAGSPSGSTAPPRH